jgi:hypothetical protein
MHIGIVMLAKRGQAPQPHHYIPYFTKYHPADNLNVQTSVFNVKERATKHKGPYEPMITARCNTEKIHVVNYAIKGAPNKRVHLNNRLQ